MSHVAVTLIIGGAALAALRLLVPAVRQARAAGDVDASTALTLGMAWLLSLPSALVMISGGLTRRPDVFDELVPVFPGWYLAGVRVAMVFVAALAGVLLLRRLTSEHVAIHTAGLVAIVLWAVANLASGLQDGRLLTLGGGVLLLCLMAATVLPRGRGACLGAGIFGVTLAIASGLLGIFRYDLAFTSCTRKCTVLGSLLTGVFTSGNQLGVALAAAIPFAYLGFRGRARDVLTLYLGGMTFATGSRTATVAALVMVVALLIVRPRLDAGRRAPGRAVIAWIVLAGAVFSSAYVVRQYHDPYPFTSRPLLWHVASGYIQKSPWLGYGPEKWADISESMGEIPRAAADSVHNQWLDVLFRAGWIGAALLVCMVFAMVSSSGNARPGVLLVLATIAMIGISERAWSVGTVDLFSFSLVALILTGATGDAETPESMARETFARSRRPQCGRGPLNRSDQVADPR